MFDAGARPFPLRPIKMFDRAFPVGLRSRLANFKERSANIAVDGDKRFKHLNLPLGFANADNDASFDENGVRDAFRLLQSLKAILSAANHDDVHFRLPLASSLTFMPRLAPDCKRNLCIGQKILIDARRGAC